MTKEIPAGYSIVKIANGFAVARVDGIPSLEIDAIYGLQLIPRDKPYKRISDAKRGLIVLRKNGRI